MNKKEKHNQITKLFFFFILLFVVSEMEDEVKGGLRQRGESSSSGSSSSKDEKDSKGVDAPVRYLEKWKEGKSDVVKAHALDAVSPRPIVLKDFAIYFITNIFPFLTLFLDQFCDYPSHAKTNEKNVFKRFDRSFLFWFLRKQFVLISLSLLLPLFHDLSIHQLLVSLSY